MITAQELQSKLTLDSLQQWVESQEDKKVIAHIQPGNRSRTCIVAIYLNDVFKDRLQDGEYIHVGNVSAQFNSSVHPSENARAVHRQDLREFVEYIDFCGVFVWTRNMILTAINKVKG